MFILDSGRTQYFTFIRTRFPVIQKILYVKSEKNVCVGIIHCCVSHQIDHNYSYWL